MPMPNLSQDLPHAKNWRYRPYNVGRFTLAPGQARKICEIKKHGYMILGGVSHDDLLLECKLELETEDELYEGVFNTGMLIAGGLIRPQVQGWWVSNNMPLVPLFVVQFTPSLWLPFYRMFRFTLQNPASNVRTATVNQVNLLAIEFRDKV